MTEKLWPHQTDLLRLVAEAGLDMIPLNVPDAVDRKGRSVGKAPMHKNWRTMPALTLAKAVDHMERHGNIGVRLREVDLVVDVDPRNFLPDDDPLARLEKDTGLDLQNSYPVVRTGSGGLHIYMTKPEGATVRDSLEEYQGVEFKTFGRQVVAIGSVHPDAKKAYEMDALSVLGLKDMGPAPETLLRLIARPGRVSAIDAGDVEPEALAAMLDVVDATQFHDHQKWLDMMMACHHATAGEGRQEFLEWSTSDPAYGDQAWSIGRRWDSLKADSTGRRVTQKTLFKHVLDAGKAAGESYNHLLPGGGPARTSAAEDFKDMIGVIDLAEDPEDLENVEGGDPNVGPLDRMNREWCCVNDDGKFRVFSQQKDYQADPIREYWERMAWTDFEKLQANNRIHSEDGKVVPVASKWLVWGGRRTYMGVVFDPAHKVPKEAKKLNLWTDWSVGAGSPHGSWDYLNELIFEGLAGGHQAMAEYILNWIAFMIQRPDQRAEVALVFRGQKGTGKGTLGKALVKLAGRHAMHISDSMHLTNHFNAHLRDCIFLFADEALWGGDKKAEGSLKQIITEERLVYEAKGRDAVDGQNMIHVMMASNEDWVIPASIEDERRFAVGDVSSKYRGNEKFFKALNQELYGRISDDDPRPAGLARFLWDMKLRELGDFHPRNSVPKTLALANQKLTSMDDLDRWWFDCLCVGTFGREYQACEGPAWDDPLNTSGSWFFTQDFRESAFAFMKGLQSRNAGRKALENAVGERVKARTGGVSLKRNRIKVPEDRIMSFERLQSDGRAHAQLIPPLQACRDQFCAHLGNKIDWDTGQPIY